MDGLVVVHRTGELQLQSSALNAIDGTGAIWTTPPGDPNQQMTIAFPARTRITHLGISNVGLAIRGRAVNKVEVEWSPDGNQFRPLTTISMTEPASDKVFEVPPVDALALRARIAGTFRNLDPADLPELLIQGAELEAASRSSLSGTWKLNQHTASLHDDGNRVLGRVDMQPSMFLDGAWDGRWMRFAWVRGPQWGIGFLAPDRSGSRLNGIAWFEEAIPQYRGEIWFGEKQGPPAGSTDPLATALTSLSRRKTFPLYLLRFDQENRLTAESDSGLELIGEIMKRLPGLHFRLVAHDGDGKDPAERKRRTDQRIASLRDAAIRRGLDMSRLSFASMGGTALRPEGDLLHYHRMHGRVDLEVVETASR